MITKETLVEKQTIDRYLYSFYLGRVFCRIQLAFVGGRYSGYSVKDPKSRTIDQSFAISDWVREKVKELEANYGTKS